MHQMLNLKSMWKNLALGLTLLAVLMPSAPAISMVSGISSTQLIPDSRRMPMTLKRFLHVGLDRIYTLDDAPLGARIPVVLVPGRAEEFQWTVWWKVFRNKALQDAQFAAHYKLYIYLYDSQRSIQYESQKFSNALHQGFDALPDDRQLLLVGYSLGGMIAKEAMEQSDIYSKVNTLFAVSVPFHGSPLLTPKWFVKNMRPRNHSPIRKIWDRLIYLTYMFNKTNLTRGLKWDNFDDSQPGSNRTGPLEMVAGEDFTETNDPMAHEIKDKLVIYGSYLENPYTRPQMKTQFNLKFPAILGTVSAVPNGLIDTVLPSYIVSVHALLNFMNLELSNIPTYSPKSAKGENQHLYRYNDGALPLSSVLYLPPRETAYEEDLNGLVKAIDVPRARIFSNLDHIDLGEFHRSQKDLTKPDILHPTEGKHTPIEWVLKDLNQIYPQVALTRQAPSIARR